MSITVEEMNLISIYHEDTRAGSWPGCGPSGPSIWATRSCFPWWTAPPGRWRL